MPIHGYLSQVVGIIVEVVQSSCIKVVRHCCLCAARLAIFEVDMLDVGWSCCLHIAQRLCRQSGLISCQDTEASQLISGTSAKEATSAPYDKRTGCAQSCAL